MRSTRSTSRELEKSVYNFYQTPSCAVLCDENVPPECILKVTDMYDQILYINEPLVNSAPGDRQAYPMQGTALSEANILYDLANDFKDWNTLESVRETRQGVKQNS